MTFSERMKDFIDQGVAASKDFALKAGAKAQDLGEQGILMVEIKRLEGQAERLLTRLGNETYKAFVERNQDSLSKNTEIETILTEIAKIRDTIEQKETELKNRRA